MAICSPSGRRAFPVPEDGLHTMGPSSRPRFFFTFRVELPAVGLEAALDRNSQFGLRLVAPTGDLVVLDLLEHRLDPVQLRAVRRQEVQVDPRAAPAPAAAALTTLLMCRLALSSTTTRGTVGRRQTARRYASRSSEVSVRSNATASSRGVGPNGPVGRQDVDPAPLRVLVRDPLALPRQAPAVAGRQRRGEARTRRGSELQRAGIGLGR